MSGGNRLQLNLALIHACQEQQKPATQGEFPGTNTESYWQRAVHLVLRLIDLLIQEMNDRLLSREHRFLTKSSPNKTARIKSKLRCMLRTRAI